MERELKKKAAALLASEQLAAQSLRSAQLELSRVQGEHEEQMARAAAAQQQSDAALTQQRATVMCSYFILFHPSNRDILA
jgi:CHASE3 domain sensor protein